jgi:small conductance mechanosensitive channel
MKAIKLYDQFYNWLIESGVHVAAGIIVLFLGIWIIRIVRSVGRRRIQRSKAHSSIRPFMFSLTITGLYIVLVLLVVDIMGLQLTMFTTILGAFGVAIGLALSGTFQNFAGGILILLLKPFLAGDYIVAQGQEGTVTSILIFYTVLITIDNRTIIIPNGKLFNEVIVNLSKENRRRLDFEVRLGYAADIDKAKKIIVDAIKSTPNIINDPAVRVGVTALDVDGLRMAVNVWLLPGDYLNTKIALMEKIIRDLGAAGIAFPKPGWS